MATLAKVMQAATIVRSWLVDHYGEGVNLAGHCIEASDLIASILSLLDSEARVVEGWVLYDNTQYCSTPYDAHTWVEVKVGTDWYYLDVTADQFNYGMDPEFRFPPIILQKGYPHGVTLEQQENVSSVTGVNLMRL